MVFQNRMNAGRKLAKRLAHLKSRAPVVLALPRGGVPVGFEIACALRAPLGLVLVRKIAMPGDPEYAIGAVAAGDPPEVILDAGILRELNLPEALISGAKDQALRELERRQAAYLRGRPPLALTGRCAILVDDGIATGYTMLAALRAVRRLSPSWLVLATPVAPPDSLAKLRREADESVCLEVRGELRAVAQFYDSFPQLKDEQVLALLAQAERFGPG